MTSESCHWAPSWFTLWSLFFLLQVSLLNIDWVIKWHRSMDDNMSSMLYYFLLGTPPTEPTKSVETPSSDSNDELFLKDWFHGQMSRQDAENLLVRDGDFLVRESTTNPGQYVLTGLQNGYPKHLLLIDPAGMVSIAWNVFQNIRVAKKLWVRGYHPWGRLTICEVSEKGLVVEHCEYKCWTYNAINQPINAKYWSVGNRIKSIRGWFKVVNGF